MSYYYHAVCIGDLSCNFDLIEVLFIDHNVLIVIAA